MNAKGKKWVKTKMTMVADILLMQFSITKMIKTIGISVIVAVVVTIEIIVKFMIIAISIMRHPTTINNNIWIKGVAIITLIKILW